MNIDYPAGNPAQPQTQPGEVPQGHVQPGHIQPGQTQPGQTQTAGAVGGTGSAPLTAAEQRFITLQGADEMLIDDLKDADVVTGDNENLGSVEDILIGGDQRIRALIVEVGGFLGMGAKKVAVSFDHFDRRFDGGGKLRLQLHATTDELKAAQEFVPRKERRG